MDPDAALSMIRAHIRAWHAWDENMPFLDAPLIASHVIELFEVLDHWMSIGGFTPTGWSGEGPGDFLTLDSAADALNEAAGKFSREVGQLGVDVDSLQDSLTGLVRLAHQISAGISAQRFFNL